MPLADGPVSIPSPAARDLWVRRAVIRQDPGPSANPLPAGLADLRLFASVIIRQVRAKRGTGNASVHVVRSTPSSTRSCWGAPATRSRRCGQAGQRHPITEGGSSVPVHLLFAELAGRWVHGVMMEVTSA